MLDKRELALEFLQITGIPPSESQAVLALQSLLKHTDAGNLEWGPPMMKINQLLANEWDYTHKTNPVTEDVERRMDDLANWLEKLDIEPGETKQTHCVNPKVNPNQVVLYRCTHCGTPSAVLRKCKCGKVRWVIFDLAVNFLGLLSDTCVLTKGTAILLARSRIGRDTS